MNQNNLCYHSTVGVGMPSPMLGEVVTYFCRTNSVVIILHLPDFFYHCPSSEICLFKVNTVITNFY